MQLPPNGRSYVNTYVKRVEPLESEFSDIQMKVKYQYTFFLY